MKDATLENVHNAGFYLEKLPERTTYSIVQKRRSVVGITGWGGAKGGTAKEPERGGAACAPVLAIWRL